MLSPMEVQYVVGLCCLRSHPDAVEVMLGNFVEDDAAQEERDVDVTVRYQDLTGQVQAFMGYEVNRRREPLGTPEVEQLTAKLADMPAVTHPAIVSGSGFTAPAIRKAQRHGVGLYTIFPWTTPVRDDFGPTTLQGTAAETFSFTTDTLEFLGTTRVTLNPRTRPEDRHGTEIGDGTPLLDSQRGIHPDFATLGALMNRALQCIQLQLGRLPGANERLMAPIPYPPNERPDGPIGTPFDLDQVMDLPAGIHFESRGELIPLTQLQVFGRVQIISTRIRETDSYIMRNHLTGEVFAGARVVRAPGDTGMLLAITLVPGSSQIAVHPVQLTAAQQHQIRRLVIHDARRS